MEAGSIEQRALAAACAVAGAHGVACERAEVLSAGSNVLVHLLPSPVVARAMTGTVALHDDPERWLSQEVAVLEFLAPSGLAVRPSPLIAPGPHQRDGLWITLVEFVELGGRTEPGEGPVRLGRALRELHDGLAGFDGELPTFADLQEDILRLLRQLRPSADLTAAEIESLEQRLRALGESVFHAPWPAQAIHGDASLSNLLRTASGRLVWNDFEDTFRGPVHWDLAGYLMAMEWHGADPKFVAAALDAYGGIDPQELEPFAAAHHVYDDVWRAYDGQRRA
jgi:hypothetical protein